MGVPYSIPFLHESSSLGQIRLHPEVQLPRSSGSALKVPGGVAHGGYMLRARIPIIIVNLHSVELS